MLATCFSCASMIPCARCQLPVVTFATLRGVNLCQPRPLLLPTEHMPLFTSLLRTLPGLPSKLLAPLRCAAVQPPVRDAAGRQPWPLPERWQSVIDTRRRAKRRVPLFVSLHLFSTAFFPPSSLVLLSLLHALNLQYPRQRPFSCNPTMKWALV